jgi:hypothetical protein
MKHLFLTLFLGFLAISCHRFSGTDESINPVDQLPPATTTGANTIGCLVNGAVMLPHQNNPLGSPSKTCFYQFVNNEWNFSLGFSNDKSNYIKDVNVFAKGILLVQGNIYPLKLNQNPGFWGHYAKATGSPDFFTDNINIGEIKINKVDMQHNIISGTLWFDAVNSNGEKVQIRDGRFDFTYTP